MKTVLLFSSLLFLTFTLLRAAEKPLILIVYHSPDGHTKAMAEAVFEGAESVSGVAVKLLKTKDVEKQDLLSAEAVIVGSPVYNANITPAEQRFINSWPFDGRMKNKLGAAFVTAGGISAGEELVQMNILHSMLIYGMVVAGGPEWTSAFGASAVTEEKPFKQSKKDPKISPYFRKKGRALGKRIAELVLKMH